MGFEIHDAVRAATKIKEMFNSLCPLSDDVQVRVKRAPPLFHIVLRDHHAIQMAEFTLVEQPNCCGVLVSTKTSVQKAYQGHGLAQQLMPLKEAIAREWGYSTLAATVNMTGNPAEVHILVKFGWVKGYQFLNARTGNQVGFFFKELHPLPPPHPPTVA